MPCTRPENPKRLRYTSAGRRASKLCEPLAAATGITLTLSLFELDRRSSGRGTVGLPCKTGFFGRGRRAAARAARAAGRRTI